MVSPLQTVNGLAPEILFFLKKRRRKSFGRVLPIDSEGTAALGPIENRKPKSPGWPAKP
jgi:hypothetical protein